MHYGLFLAVVIISVLQMGTVRAEEPALPLSQLIPAELDGYALSPPDLKFGAQWPYQFPQDYAAHEGYRAELWQWYVLVADAAGRQWGVGGRMLRFAIAAKSTVSAQPSAWHFTDVFVSTQTIVDIELDQAKNQHHLSRAALGLAGTVNNPATVWVRAQQLQLNGRGVCGLSVAVDAVVDGQTIELELQSSSCAIPGSAMSAASIFGYTQSIDRVRGFIGEHAISEGRGWLDRAWGELPVGEGPGRQVGGSQDSGERESRPVDAGARAPVVADQFRIRLSAAEQIIILQTRRRSGKGRPRWSAFHWQQERGVLESLDDVEIQALSSWTSPESNQSYASAWRLSINRNGTNPRQWLLTPVVANQEVSQYGDVRWTGFAQVEYQGEVVPDAFAVVDLAPES